MWAGARIAHKKRCLRLEINLRTRNYSCMGKPSSETFDIESLEVAIRQMLRNLNGCQAAISEARAKGMEHVWVRKAGGFANSKAFIGNLEECLWESTDWVWDGDPAEGETREKQK